MTTWARNIDDYAIDVVTTDPAELFHEEVAAQFIEVPDGTLPNAHLVEGEWVNPEPQPEPEPQHTYTPMAATVFYRAFTVQERVAIKKLAATEPATPATEEVAEFLATLQMAISQGEQVDPNSKTVTEGLAGLTHAGLLAEGRADQIRQGIPQ